MSQKQELLMLKQFVLIARPPEEGKRQIATFKNMYYPLR